MAVNQQPNFTSEAIVVDNNSTDKTAELAKQVGARVVFEPINQIGHARNAVVAAATGEWLLFLDADSLLNPGMVADILQLIKQGKSVGCGSAMHMPGLHWWGSAVLYLWTAMSILFRWASGALVVCRADAFREVGGFNQELYAADEIDLSNLLKKWGKTRLEVFNPDPTSIGNIITKNTPLYTTGNCRSVCAPDIQSTSHIKKQEKFIDMV